MNGNSIDNFENEADSQLIEFLSEMPGLTLSQKLEEFVIDY
jgi:hypothetical protein